MGLSLLSQPAQALNWNFSYTLNDGGVYTGTYITDGSSPAATDTVYNVTGISGTITKGATTVSISGLDNSNSSPFAGNNTFKWDGTGIGVKEWGIRFTDTNGGEYNLTGVDPTDPSYVFTGLGIFANAQGISDGDIVTSSFAPATAVPWETDALPVVGSTILFGAGLWAKRKFAKPLQK
jgi:hypothetical protein